jgi:hypothetical protein
MPNKSLYMCIRHRVSVATRVPRRAIILAYHSLTRVCCRDSSLYGRVQTISQDLILDLLKRGDLRDFRVFAYIACFAFPHILRISRISRFRFLAFSRISHIVCISRSHTVRISRTYISCGFHISVYFTFRIFAFSHFSRFDMCYRVPPWDPSHSVCMSCPHPPRSIGAYFTLFHLHYIIYVFAFPFMFTYLVMCLYYITLVRLALPTRLRGLGTHLAC